MDRNELEVINFTNITNKEWSHSWGGEPYVFAPGQTKAFPRFMAEHFAKHLGDRILIDAGKDFAMESPERKEITEKILGKVAVPAQIEEIAKPEEPEFEEVPVEAIETSAEVPVEPKKRGRKKA